MLTLVFVAVALGDDQKPKMVNSTLEFLSKDGSKAIHLELHEENNFVQMKNYGDYPLSVVFRSFEVIDDFCIVISTVYERDYNNQRLKYISVNATIAKYDYYGLKLWQKNLSFTDDDIITPDGTMDDIYGIGFYNSPDLGAIILNVGGIYSWGLKNRIEVISYDGDSINSLDWSDVGLYEFRGVYTLPTPEKYILIDGRTTTGFVIIVWDAKNDRIIKRIPIDQNDVVDGWSTDGKFTIRNQLTNEIIEANVSSRVNDDK